MQVECTCLRPRTRGTQHLTIGVQFCFEPNTMRDKRCHPHDAFILIKLISINLQRGCNKGMRQCTCWVAFSCNTCRASCVVLPSCRAVCSCPLTSASCCACSALCSSHNTAACSCSVCIMSLNCLLTVACSWDISFTCALLHCA